MHMLVQWCTCWCNGAHAGLLPIQVDARCMGVDVTAQNTAQTWAFLGFDDQNREWVSICCAWAPHSRDQLYCCGSMHRSADKACICCRPMQ